MSLCVSITTNQVVALEEGKSLSLGIPEDQFTSPCPWTSSPVLVLRPQVLFLGPQTPWKFPETPWKYDRVKSINSVTTTCMRLQWRMAYLLILDINSQQVQAILHCNPVLLKVLKESHCPRGPIYKSLSSSLKSLIITLSTNIFM